MIQSFFKRKRNICDLSVKIKQQQWMSLELKDAESIEWQISCNWWLIPQSVNVQINFSLIQFELYGLRREILLSQLQLQVLQT